MGPFPVFYWPRIVADIDDEQPPLRQFFFRTNNYFGQQFLTDWNGFTVLLGVKKPDWIDLWNIDVDYLSARTKRFPALGTEIGWFGRDLITRPARPLPSRSAAASEISPTTTSATSTSGACKDSGTDVLGPGPAIVTNGPPGAGKAGIQLSSTPAVPAGPRPVQHCATCSRSSPTTTSTSSRTSGSSSRSPTSPTATSSRNTTSGSSRSGIDQETLAYGICQKENHGRRRLDRGQPQNW